MLSFQRRVADWVRRCFPEQGQSVPVRSLRFIEEALELVQAAGISREDAHRMVEYVYDRPAGRIPDEIGGVMITLAALAEACREDVLLCAEDGLLRCEELIDKIRARNLTKPIPSS